MSSLSAVTPEAKALVAGLAIGDKSLMPLALAKDMKTVSLTHLMAVSGANCAIVAGCVTLLLKRVRLSRNTRAICTSLAIAGYVALVGPEPSVIRSGFMAITVVVALSIGRKPVPIAALGFAVLCLLVVDPWLSVSFGFALSVAATAGILLLTPAVYDRLSRRLPKYLALSVAVSIAAQIFCLPILLQLQDGLSTYSLLANVIVEPLVAPITVLGILACTVAWFAPWLSSWFTALAGLGTWIIAESAHFFANLPMATLKWAGGVPAIILGVGIAMTSLTWFRLKAGWLRLASCLFLLVTVAATFVAQVPVQRLTSNWPPQDWQIVQCDVGQGDALILRSKGAVAVIDVGREDSPIDECLSNLSVDVIDLLVLTHFDMDHVGGLAGAIKGRLV